jgi:Tol biopolymer transport system component
MTAARPIAALLISVVLYSNPQPGASFVTVAQHDGARSLASMASVDVSADGRFVAFESYAQLVPADTDTNRDIYLLDRASGKVTLESSMFSRFTDNAHPRLSAEGRWLVFEAEQEVEVLHLLRIEIAVVDRASGSMRLVMAPHGEGSNGSSHSPEISDDGRVIVFSSVATNLVDGVDANGMLEDVYAMDTSSGTVRRISVDTAGKQPSTGFSFSPTISGDGRVIAFTSSAPLTPSTGRPSAPTGLAAGFALRQVYVRDENTKTTTQISVGENGEWPDGASVRPAVSADGRYVAFTSEATRLVKNDTNRVADVFLHDRTTATTRIVTHGSDGRPANGRSTAPAISSDGRFIVLQSDASNLVCAKRCAAPDDDLNLLWDVFRWDRDHDTIVRLSDDALGPWAEPSIGPALDAFGGIVAFASRHPMDASDRANDFDLFVRDVPDAQTTLVRRRDR